MKSFVLGSLALAIMLTGCATPTRVSSLEGKGTKRAFDAPYNAVWRAAMEAAQQGDLEIIHADRPRGYISVRSGVAAANNGEIVGLWVRSLGPSGTEVEVVSRQPRKPAARLKNWETEIILAIATSLSRDKPAVGGTGNQVYTQIHIDPAFVVPDGRAPSTTLAPESRGQVERRLETLRDVEKRLEDLRAKQREREAELQPEEDEDRREELRAEIERLREELRIQEERLKELEKDRR